LAYREAGILPFLGKQVNKTSPAALWINLKFAGGDPVDARGRADGAGAGTGL
jgi:hypothetical protein